MFSGSQEGAVVCFKVYFFFIEKRGGEPRIVYRGCKWAEVAKAVAGGALQ